MTKAPPKSNVIQFSKGPLNTWGFREKINAKNQLQVEMALMQIRSGSLRHRDGSRNEKGLPAWRHFMNAVDLVWNYKDSPTPFIWHPWAIQYAKDAFKHKRYAVTSGGSGGKTEFFAVYALIWWLANPFANVVLVNTTTLKDADGRIWGSITKFYSGMIAAPPGKLVSSAHAIKTVDPKTGQQLDKFGIRLFACEKSKEAESSRAIRGQKHGPNGKIIVIMDEAAELGPAIKNAFEENLTQNPNHQLIALANANSPFDNFGEMCKPKDGGWEKYDPDWEEWEGEGAFVRRVSIETSPNIIYGRTIYPFLMTREMLKEKREQLSRNGEPYWKKKAYWRGVLGAFLLDGDDETIYSPGELLKVPADCVWQGVPTKVAGFDISHTVGGDKSVLTIGTIGICVDGKKRLRFDKHIELDEDVTRKDVDRTTQMVEKLKEICQREGVTIENIGVDATAGGGKTFSDAIWSKWSNRFLRVDFGGKASDRPVSAADREKSSVRYSNRVSEIWSVGKELIRCDQLRNITKEMAEDMTSRRYKDNKAQDGGSRIKVESKVDMKKRIGRSPDVADSAFVLLELCRERHGLSSIDKPGNYSGTKTNPLKKRFMGLAELFAA